MAINFSGLSSGLDTNAIVDALVKVARQPIDRLQTKKQTYTTQLSTLSDLGTKLASLRSAARALDTATEFKSFSASASDTTKLTALADSGAVAGTYAVNVVSLAQAQRSCSKAFTDNDTPLPEIGTGQLGIKVGSGDWKYVTVTASDTLQSIAQNINDANAGVTASVIKYSDTEYRLMVSGTATGAANAVQFSQGAGLTLDLTTAVGDEAKDAEIVLGNQTSSIKRSTNQISDAIPGVTLSLLAKTASPVSVAVAVDSDAIVSKASNLVSAYNSVATLIHDQFAYTGQARQDSLMGDPAVGQIKAQLQSALTAQVPGASSSYDALSRVGVSTNRDGTIALDTAKLKAALAADFEGVTRLFTTTDGNDATENDGIAVRLARAVDRIVRSGDGLLAMREKGINDSVGIIDDRVAAMERNVTSYTDGLKRQFAALETLMSSIQSQGSALAQQLK